MPITNVQETGFALDEIKPILPESITVWRHDALLPALRKKIQDIESMEVRLAQNKAHLQSLIQLIDAKPADMDCADNAVRVLDSMGIPMGNKAGIKK